MILGNFPNWKKNTRTNVWSTPNRQQYSWTWIWTFDISKLFLLCTKLVCEEYKTHQDQAGLIILCSNTKHQLAVRPRGIRQIWIYGWKALNEAHPMVRVKIFYLLFFGELFLKRHPLFLPWNQVDLILRKSGQPFFWALVFQIRTVLKNQSNSQNQLR